MQRIQLQAETSLTLQELEAIALGARLELSEAHWQAVARCREFLDQLIAGKRRIYGVTTGYGPLANTYVDTESSAQLQQGLVHHLTSGTGPLLKKEQVRAIMAARAVTLARGHSAIRPEALQLLLDCLEKDLIPQVPAIGTVGASGDLTPLAHITLGLMGQGDVWLKEANLPAQQALQQAGLQPLNPQGKDALALVNGTSAMTAIAALNACQAKRLLELSVSLTGLYGELLNGHLEALQPGLAQLRPHPGQLWAQEALLAACVDSQRLQGVEQPPPRLPEDLAAGTARHNQPLPQDAYTFRCAPQHLGAVKDTLDFHQQVVEREVWSVTDNPLFLPDTQEVLHGGNFFGQHVALAADALNNALITLAVHSERRIARITDPSMNQGLPPFLRGNNNGLHSGFMGAQVTATALVAEMRTQASPASIQSIATNANNQDVVTMGTLAARRCATTLERLTELLAIESLILSQGYELRGGQSAGFSRSASQLHQAVRKIADGLTDDRPLAGDIQKLSQQLADPAFIAALQTKPGL
ncbi:histidine ammonia-lyase [Marinospirillum sp.]|uniref:HAL/PAL/TAL family ammonia-lyase n=1 Tax=Marinospirillum sp. TaxID=2183934 RepID=UPI00384E2018